MNDLPDSRDLLETARHALTSEILPALPDALRYTGLMIANAMAIAERGIAAGDTAGQAEHDRLAALLRERGVARHGGALHDALADYNRRLANEIRTGKFDGEERAAMLDHLRRTTEEKLAVSNPKALAAPGDSRAETRSHQPPIDADKRR